MISKRDSSRSDPENRLTNPLFNSAARSISSSHQFTPLDGLQSSGKSTLAKRLGEITGLPAVELDRIFWQPGLLATSRKEWACAQELLVANERWNVGRWTVGCAAVAVVAVSYAVTTGFRNDVVEDEFRIRIEPALVAVRAAARDKAGEDCILALEPLILQMYAERTVDVLSLHELHAAVLRNIGFYWRAYVSSLRRRSQAMQSSQSSRFTEVMIALASAP